MISGLNRESETLASLNVAQALLVALRDKGILSDAEIGDLLSEVSASMDTSPLVQVQGAAEIVKAMRQEALTH